MAFMLFRGLKTLTTLRDFSLIEPKDISRILKNMKNSLKYYPDIITVASMRFHPFLIYES